MKWLFSLRTNRGFELRMPEGSPGSSYSTRLPSQQASSPSPSVGNLVNPFQEDEKRTPNPECSPHFLSLASAAVCFSVSKL